ncbi:oxidoreductase, partial [Actinophytocola sp.]|uniref:oxidoreductase n=1 Tax=Actinophytocola sp. TaxID=1872138 RepID=UPI002D633E85
MKRVLMISLLVLATFLVAPPGANATTPTWQPSVTGSQARLRGLSAVSRHVAWASGSGGTVLRTVDGGRGWQQVAPPDTAALDFRDVEAFDARTAVALTAGQGTDARIYRTGDGGRTWTAAFQNADPAAFYNCLAFFDARHGLATGDPVDGEFNVLSTSDGGRSWTHLRGPAALAGEYQFSASGQCVTVSGRRDAWLATGGGPVARVLHSSDRGRTWTAAETPLASSESAGVFAVAFRDPRTGVAVGGDYANPTVGTHALALSRDAGRTWREP